MKYKPKAEDIIEKLKLAPLNVEGGYFRETYRSGILIEFKNKDGKIEKRSICTAIYYLITKGSYSHLHMLAHDEIFHFYFGDPVDMILLHPDGRHEIRTMGPEILKGETVQLTVSTNTWQGAKLKKDGDFALLGTTVSPGFDYNDYFAGEDFLNDIFLKFPDCREIIKEYI